MIVGAALLTVNGTVEDCAIPGLSTKIKYVPAVASLAAGIVAYNLFTESYVVDKG